MKILLQRKLPDLWYTTSKFDIILMTDTCVMDGHLLQIEDILRNNFLATPPLYRWWRVATSNAGYRERLTLFHYVYLH